MNIIRSVINALSPSQPQPTTSSTLTSTTSPRLLEGGLAGPTSTPSPTTTTTTTTTKSKPRHTTCIPGPLVLASRPPKHKTRARIFDDCITLLGYPSRGGFIVLERAGAVDFDFLNLSRFNPPLNRAIDPEAEDEFCQRLLLIGAKWFDSESRYSFLAGVRENFYEAIRDLESGRRLELTLGERRWVCIGWPSEPSGSLWVGEWDTNLPGILEEEWQVPNDAARLTLATNMNERCEILEGMGAKFCKNLDEYEGGTYLKAWQTKWEGEVEPLERTWGKGVT